MFILNVQMRLCVHNSVFFFYPKGF